MTVCIKSYFYGVVLFDSSTVQYVYVDTWHGNITVQYNYQITFQWGVFVRFQNLNPSFSTLLAHFVQTTLIRKRCNTIGLQIGNDRQIVYSSPQQRKMLSWKGVPFYCASEMWHCWFDWKVSPWTAAPSHYAPEMCEIVLLLNWIGHFWGTVKLDSENVDSHFICWHGESNFVFRAIQRL